MAMNSLIISFEKSDFGYTASTYYNGKVVTAYGENYHDALLNLAMQLEDALGDTNTD